MNREEQLRQNDYRQRHRERVIRRREPTGRDVAATLSEMYVAGAVRSQEVGSHKALVRHLVSRGFNEKASLNFIERMVDRARRAIEERDLDDERDPYQC